jgi:hypothetical protein
MRKPLVTGRVVLVMPLVEISWTFEILGSRKSGWSRQIENGSLPEQKSV